MLLRSKIRELFRKKPLPNIPGNAFAAEGDVIRASVMPGNGTVSAQRYGLQPSQMRLLFAAVDCPLTEGDGLCVEVPETANPDFKVVYTQRWARHIRADLQYIPEEERGASE